MYHEKEMMITLHGLLLQLQNDILKIGDFGSVFVIAEMRSRGNFQMCLSNKTMLKNSVQAQKSILKEAC